MFLKNKLFLRFLLSDVHTILVIKIFSDVKFDTIIVVLKTKIKIAAVNVKYFLLAFGVSMKFQHPLLINNHSG